MKRIISAVILLAASLIITSISLIITSNIDSGISNTAQKLEYALDTKSDSAPALYEELSSSWDKYYKVCSVYISHQHLEETEKLVTSLGKYIEQKEYRTGAVICSQISKAVHHLYTSETPTIQNIF